MTGRAALAAGWREVPWREVRREGWAPAPAAAYDHDDPTRPPQVEDSRGGGR